MAGNSRGDSAKKIQPSEGSLDESMSQSQKSLVDEITTISKINEKMARDLIDEGYSGLKDIFQAE
ncbi:MAG: hypothetical protein ACOC8Y_02380, partial [Candidatus Natronoplasma sp.]